MRLNDVANQLRTLLPQYTDQFSSNFSTSSISSDGATTTVVTSAAHGLATNNYVVLTNVAFHNIILGFTKDGLNFTFQTTASHDVTRGWFRIPSDLTTEDTVELDGFTDPNWNGVFPLTTASDRTHFTAQSTVSDPTLNGSEYLKEVKYGGVNGAQQITVVNTTTFTFPSVAPAGVYSGGKVSTVPRVVVAIDGPDLWNRIITPRATNEFTLAVLPTPVSTSKDRSEFSDATAALQKGTNMRLKILTGFALLIIAPVHEELSAGYAIDVCRCDLRGPIYKCLFGAQFETGTENRADYKLIPVNDDVVNFDNATLVYSYEFQMPVDLITADSVPKSQTSAFRDIDYTLDMGDGVTNSIILDDN